MRIKINRIILVAIFIFASLSGFYSAFTLVWKEPVKDYKFKCGVYGGQLFLATNSDPKSFNPIVAKETSTTQITSLLFEGLTRTDPRTLEVVPNLAKRWETRDNREWIFYLRDDVYWSDGEKFTARDVVFTFNDLIYNPDIPSSSRDLFTIEGKKIKVEQLDDYTVRFILPSEFSPFLRSLSQEILPSHKYKKIVDEGRFTFSMGLNSKTEDIVGTGPFIIKEYLPGERVVLSRNSYYWKKDACGNRLPYLDGIVFVILPNPETSLLKFIEKEIDYYSLRPQDLPILGPLQEKKKFTIYNAGVAFGSNFVVLNQNPGINPYTKKPYVKKYKLRWFRNKMFRKAISYGINRRKIIDVVMNGLGVPQYSPLSPANVLFYSDKVIKYPYSPDKARSLLHRIGFKDRDGDGILEDEQGHKLQINFFTNANNPLRVTIATMISRDLSELGFKIHFLPLDFNNLVNKLTATYDWEMILIGLTGGIEPYFGKNVWSYKGVLHAWNPTGEPLDDYEVEIEGIFNESVKTSDIEVRKKLFDRWQYLVSDNLPFIYTVLGYSLYAVSDRLGNIFPTVYGGAFSEIEHIYIKRTDDD